MEILNYINNYQIPPMRWADTTIPIGAGIIYSLTVWLLPHLLSDTKPLKLKVAYFIHNVLLCLASLAMCVCTTYAVARRAYTHGLYSIYCDPEYIHDRGDMWFWFQCFYLSKYWEMLDTMFLILQKKPVTMLHAYHHASMPLTCWLVLENKGTIGWLPLILNSGVHVVMYFYYAGTTLNYRPWWKKYITIMQLIQFFTGLAGNTPYLFMGCRKYNYDCLAFEVQCVVFAIWFYAFYRKTYEPRSAANNKLTSEKTKKAE
eukprot:GILK01012433.1.p1 GENE.GILK01012433.1~~GILK01012433.1.p1  ORF type:complete len:259 (+),score=34.42 GILK01012433.1:157-933(+)